jgi:predicted transcriptional regulator
MVAARQAFARIAINGFGHRVAAVAGLLNKHPNSVSRWISAGRAPEDVEAILARVLKELEKSMVNSDSATRLFDC